MVKSALKGHYIAMRRHGPNPAAASVRASPATSALPTPLALMTALTVLAMAACGSKGDPVPVQRLPPVACAVSAKGLRTLEVTLPTTDTGGRRLSGLETLRVFYLPLGPAFPSAQDVLEAIAQGKAVVEVRRPDLPGPGKTLKLDFSNLDRPAGWLVVVAYRGANVPGVPTGPLPWLDRAF